MKLSVIGLGKLGMVMAAVFANRGHEVLGIDCNESIVKAIEKGECPIQETGLAELLQNCGNHLTVSTSYYGVENSGIVFIIVPTPSGEDGAFTNDYVVSAVSSVAESVKGCLHFPLIVVTSTVMPGSMDNVIMPVFRQITGHNGYFAYNPEFIALGSVIRDMEHPDAILIGESNSMAGNLLCQFYHRFYNGNPPPISRMNMMNAEVAKMALNTFVTTKISLANTYAMICDKMKCGNVDDITNFLGLDSRIGSKYLKGGMAFSGHCFPRDNRAFQIFAKKLGIETPIQKATDRVNSLITSTVINDTLHLIKGDTISLLGLTFKPNSPEIEESPSIIIAQTLSERYKLKVYDPMGMDNARRVLNEKVEYCNSVSECLKDSDLCIIATPWGEFRHIGFDGMRNKVVLDCWRMLNNKHDVEYHALGVNG